MIICRGERSVNSSTWRATSKSQKGWQIPGGFTQLQTFWLWKLSCTTSVFPTLSAWNVTVNACKVVSFTLRKNMCPSTAGKWMLTNANTYTSHWGAPTYTAKVFAYLKQIWLPCSSKTLPLPRATQSCHCQCTPISSQTDSIIKMLFSSMLHCCWHHSHPNFNSTQLKLNDCMIFSTQFLWKKIQWRWDVDFQVFKVLFLK